MEFHVQFYLFSICYMLYPQAETAFQARYFKIQRSFRLANGVSNGEIPAAYQVLCVADCALLCLRLTPATCRSVSYRRDSRTCHINTKAAGDSDGVEVVADENWDYLFDKIAASCSDWKKLTDTSGLYWVDPDGAGGVSAFEVYCDMSTTPPTVSFHHDHEERTRVKDYDPPLSYSVTLAYGVNLEQIAAYVDRDETSCSQYMKYECFNSVLYSGMGILYGAWYDRHGQVAPFWAGGDPNGTMANCACSRNDSCAGVGCNCNKNDLIWRSDEGVITESNYLPISVVKFGDTGGTEEGYHTVGPVICRG